jgi:hypothetical protein
LSRNGDTALNLIANKHFASQPYDDFTAAALRGAVNGFAARQMRNNPSAKGRGAGEKLRGKSDESDESDESDRSTADADARNSPPFCNERSHCKTIAHFTSDSHLRKIN